MFTDSHGVLVHTSGQGLGAGDKGTARLKIQKGAGIQDRTSTAMRGSSFNNCPCP